MSICSNRVVPWQDLIFAHDEGESPSYGICGLLGTRNTPAYIHQSRSSSVHNCRLQAEALIELFKSISVVGKWPKNRLPGHLAFHHSVIESVGAQVYEMATIHSSGLLPRNSPKDIPDLSAFSNTYPDFAVRINLDECVGLISPIDGSRCRDG
jgi:hypothetical protein